MTSLGETYERRAGEASQRRVYLGTGLFAAGALLVVGGILAGGTGLLINNGFGQYESREIAGILAGLGVPAVFVGIFSVLPANKVQRAAAAVGAGITVLGVMLFRATYPYLYVPGSGGVPTTGTLAFILVYAAGIITTFWCLFTAVATFKTRNDPGGTVTLTVTKNGETHTVEVPANEVESAREALTSGTFGGVGVFGGVEDPDEETRANASEPKPSSGAVASSSGPAGQSSGSSSGGSSSGGLSSSQSKSTTSSRTSTSSGGTRGPAAPGTGSPSVSDGGATSQEITSPLDDEQRASAGDGPGPDKYCGNCEHFDYVDSESGMQPYCGLYEEEMDDMEACNWWEQNG
jgi:cytochrome c biogenesis protein CcdA